MISTATSDRELAHARLRRVIALHFDPKKGSPYWLERERQLGISARRQIRSVEDLALLGPMEAEALASRPIEDFIPAALLERRTEFIVAETAGTLGRPKFAVHRADEFHAAFVEPFVQAARRAGFPRDVNWLFIGPGGPHIIGKAARCCAQAMGAPDPFTVDFDPRWAKKLPEGSFARTRYLEHLQAQALQVLAAQRVGVVFSTPPVLEGLCGRMTPEKREEIRGIHFGGMPMSNALRKRLADMLPNAVMLSGYGNTLFGMSPELAFRAGVNTPAVRGGCRQAPFYRVPSGRADAETGIDYYPHGARLVIRVIEEDGSDEVRLGRPVPYGERGQVVVHRLDETQFIANMFERDTAVRIPPRRDAVADGFVLDGIRDPQPIRSETVKPAMGLY